MRALVLVALVSLALVVPAASAVVYAPPVCLQKSAGALGTTAKAQLTCEAWVEVAHCPPAGDGPCRALVVGPLLP